MHLFSEVFSLLSLSAATAQKLDIQEKKGPWWKLRREILSCNFCMTQEHKESGCCSEHSKEPMDLWLSEYLRCWRKWSGLQRNISLTFATNGKKDHAWHCGVRKFTRQYHRNSLHQQAFLGIQFSEIITNSGSTPFWQQNSDHHGKSIFGCSLLKSGKVEMSIRIRQPIWNELCNDSNDWHTSYTWLTRTNQSEWRRRCIHCIVKFRTILHLDWKGQPN